MRIGICGTHCAGKTTLAKALGEKYGLSMILDVAASMPKATIRDQLAIMKAQMDAETWCSSNEGGFVSDRTVCDNWAYITQFANDDELLYGLATYLKWAYIKTAYDLIVFVDEYFSIEDNGRRSIDSALQKLIYRLLATDIIITSFCNDLPICAVKGSTEERIKQIEDWCHEHNRSL